MQVKDVDDARSGMDNRRSRSIARPSAASNRAFAMMAINLHLVRPLISVVERSQLPCGTPVYDGDWDTGTVGSCTVHSCSRIIACSVLVRSYVARISSLLLRARAASREI